MKTRNGFVSNSSSSSFVFIQKGKTQEELFALMRKWHQLFALVGETWQAASEEEETICVQVDDVIQAIKNIKGKKWQPMPKIISCKKLLKSYEDRKKVAQEELKRIGEDQQKEWLRESYMRELMDSWSRIDSLQDLMKDGFQTALKVSFGDNHGHIAGDPVGTLMDRYHGQIACRREDLIIWTESEH